MEVSELMTTSVHTISSGKSIAYASERMNERKVGSLVVMDHGTVCGIITSRDIRASHPNRIVADAMTPEPIAVSSDQFVWDAVKIMDRHGIERVVVMDGDRLAGLVTREEIAIKLSQYADPLTGLYRAPYIQSIGAKFLKRGQPFHLLFIDLNEFGLINKRYGHPFGDDVIRAFSDRLAGAVAEGRDFLSRYAGDEFVMITLGNETEAEELVRYAAQPVAVGGIAVSSAVGHVDVHRESDFSKLSFRDVLEKASLLSTSRKMSAVAES
ncbi:GGDEF domain-containing protein [Cohnella caldifontis]|uniref:GGDEF domain-containing protein n=1 Tax=Cohnella caldifontis TaxID=3027471 RepID=UPI0023EB3755|nr:GGDEF domain-containing protein [Cohnella sp. YIM B05605]